MALKEVLVCGLTVAVFVPVTTALCCWVRHIPVEQWFGWKQDRPFWFILAVAWIGTMLFAGLLLGSSATTGAKINRDRMDDNGAIDQ